MGEGEGLFVFVSESRSEGEVRLVLLMSGASSAVVEAGALNLASPFDLLKMADHPEVCMITKGRSHSYHGRSTCDRRWRGEWKNVIE